MWHETRLDWDFFAMLTECDAAIARRVAAGGCRSCGGPLHQSNYQRKPRGGLVAEADVVVRFSLCCGREGCRKRALPPSVRFLGRRVYWEAVVLLSTIRVLLTGVLGQVARMDGVPARTLKRWLSWWRKEFPQSSLWLVIRARCAPPPPDETRLPLSLLERLATDMKKPDAPSEVSSLLIQAARWLAPMTTQLVADCSRLVWDAIQG